MSPPRSVAWALTVAALLSGCLPSGPPASSTPARVALVVVGPDGESRSTCVTIDDPVPTGRSLLEASALPIVLDERNAMGALVCAIDANGCAYPSEPCLCECAHLGACRYWAYFVRTPPGDWVYSAQGVSLQPVHDGELHAWLWLDASWTGTAAVGLLPDADFESICP